MTEHEFQVYDLARRICEADHELHEAHQTDIAALAATEGVVDEQEGLFKVVDILRPVLKRLVAEGYLKLRPHCVNTYMLEKDLLTVMAARL